MMPIHQLLNRIRHDKEFGRGRFVIGYLDRLEGTIHRVPFHQIVFPSGERRTFEVLDEAGQLRRIPFHRVREVYRDGERIWQRQNAVLVRRRANPVDAYARAHWRNRPYPASRPSRLHC